MDFSIYRQNTLSKIDFKSRLSHSGTVSNPTQAVAVNNSCAKLPLGNVYGIKINNVSFKGFWADQNPAKRLYWILTGTNDVYEDGYTNSHLYKGVNSASWKKWVVAPPNELLVRSPQEAISSIATLTKGNGFPGIATGIYSPDYGNNWGRHANYIEINPRVLGTMKDGRSREGLLGAIKLLPAIPASPKSFANCVILSQLYPSLGCDGKQGNDSLYAVNLKSGISKNLTSDWLERDGQSINDFELVKAFNDLAHMRGLKTGFRMPLSEGQLRVQGNNFSWANKSDEEAFIQACCDAVDMGFDAIYFDSAKHVGRYDSWNYRGVGNLPDYQKMQYINYEIRNRTGRQDISLIGEKANDDIEHFAGLGLSAGTDWGNADNKESVLWESKKQSWSQSYAAGPEVSNDNATGGMSHNQRLNRINTVLFTYENPANKLPTYMQMNDIFPLNWGTNTHDLMMNNRSFSAFADPVSHWNNLFDNSDASSWYREKVNEEFAWAAEK